MEKSRRDLRRRYFFANLFGEKRPDFFKTWQEAKKYLGEECVVSFTESPDVVGRMTGIELTLTLSGDVTGCHVRINNIPFQFWKVKPLKCK